MAIEHLPTTAKPEEIAAILERDGCAVVDRLAEPGQLERVQGEIVPLLESTPPGSDSFSGTDTRRMGSLIARTPSVRELITHPTALATTRALLADATNFQLHLTQVIAIGPGQAEQAIHRDQWAFDFFPFPSGYEVQCNTIWALTDFTEENGATRVIPGSNKLADKLRFTQDDTVPAEMEAGSALFYTGALYHGGGANRSQDVRIGLNLTYCRGWLRQEENQYLSVPREMAAELPDDLLRLMGYARGAYALGYFGDLEDPIEAVKPRAGKLGFGDAPPRDPTRRASS